MKVTKKIVELDGIGKKSYKTNEAVKHAYRLADIAIDCIKEQL